MLGTFPTLHTDRLNLVEIKQEHLGDIFRLFSDSKVTHFYNVVTLAKKDEAQKFYRLVSHRFTEQVAICWGLL